MTAEGGLALLIVMVAGAVPLLTGAALVMGLVFRREIASVLHARRLGARLDDFVCERCGWCCTLRVPASHQTLARIEAESGRPHRTWAHRLPGGGGILKRAFNGACRLRTGPDAQGGHACSVYAVRPLACRRFPIEYWPFGVRGADSRCPQIQRMLQAPPPT